jgi:hypothetical protein
MLELLYSVLAALRVFACSRSDTALDVLGLRQQVAVLKRQRPRPTLTRLDRFFWTTPPASVAPMVGRPAHRETGDRGPVTASRLSPLLALAIPTARGPAADQRGDSDSDPAVSVDAALLVECQLLAQEQVVPTKKSVHVRLRGAAARALPSSIQCDHVRDGIARRGVDGVP